MLYNLDDIEVTKLPHKQTFDLHRSNLSDADYEAAAAAINAYVDSAGDCFISSYIPGENWTNTPYQPLYIACNQSEEQSALFFGLIVWKVMMERQDDWYFKPADKEAEDILGMTYFRREPKGAV